MLEKMINEIEKKYKKDGEWIRTVREKTIYYDKDGREIDVCDAAFRGKGYERKEKIEYEVSEGGTNNYWLDTAANALKPLFQLIALAKMRPDCIWDGD